MADKDTLSDGELEDGEVLSSDEEEDGPGSAKEQKLDSTSASSLEDGGKSETQKEGHEKRRQDGRREDESSRHGEIDSDDEEAAYYPSRVRNRTSTRDKSSPHDDTKQKSPSRHRDRDRGSSPERGGARRDGSEGRGRQKSPRSRVRSSDDERERSSDDQDVSSRNHKRSSDRERDHSRDHHNSPSGSRFSGRWESGRDSDSDSHHHSSSTHFGNKVGRGGRRFGGYSQTQNYQQRSGNKYGRGASGRGTNYGGYSNRNFHGSNEQKSSGGSGPEDVIGRLQKGLSLLPPPKEPQCDNLDQFNYPAPPSWYLQEVEEWERKENETKGTTPSQTPLDPQTVESGKDVIHPPPPTIAPQAIVVPNFTAMSGFYSVPPPPPTSVSNFSPATLLPNFPPTSVPNFTPPTSLSNFTPLTSVPNFAPLTSVSNSTPLTSVPNFVPPTSVPNFAPPTPTSVPNFVPPTSVPNFPPPTVSPPTSVNFPLPIIVPPPTNFRSPIGAPNFPPSTILPPAGLPTPPTGLSIPPTGLLVPLTGMPTLPTGVPPTPPTGVPNFSPPSILSNQENKVENVPVSASSSVQIATTSQGVIQQWSVPDMTLASSSLAPVSATSAMTSVHLATQPTSVKSATDLHTMTSNPPPNFVSSIEVSLAESASNPQLTESAANLSSVQGIVESVPYATTAVGSDDGDASMTTHAEAGLGDAKEGVALPTGPIDSDDRDDLKVEDMELDTSADSCGEGNEGVTEGVASDETRGNTGETERTRQGNTDELEKVNPQEKFIKLSEIARLQVYVAPVTLSEHTATTTTSQETPSLQDTLSLQDTPPQKEKFTQDDSSLQVIKPSPLPPQTVPPISELPSVPPSSVTIVGDITASQSPSLMPHSAKSQSSEEVVIINEENPVYSLRSRGRGKKRAGPSLNKPSAFRPKLLSESDNEVSYDDYLDQLLDEEEEDVEEVLDDDYDEEEAISGLILKDALTGDFPVIKDDPATKENATLNDYLSRDLPTVDNSVSHEDSPSPGSKSSRPKRKSARRCQKEVAWWSKQKEKEQKSAELEKLKAERMKSKGPCKYYLNGFCKHGTSCEYSHEGTPTKKRDICKFYLVDNCSKGENCSFYHGDFPCKFFHTKAYCKNRDKCKFSHAPLTPHTRELLLSVVDPQLVSPGPVDLVISIPKVIVEEPLVVSVPLSKLEDKTRLKFFSIPKLRQANASNQPTKTPVGLPAQVGSGNTNQLQVSMSEGGQTPFHSIKPQDPIQTGSSIPNQSQPVPLFPPKNPSLQQLHPSNPSFSPPRMNMPAPLPPVPPPLAVPPLAVPPVNIPPIGENSQRKVLLPTPSPNLKLLPDDFKKLKPMEYWENPSINQQSHASPPQQQQQQQQQQQTQYPQGPHPPSSSVPTHPPNAPQSSGHAPQPPLYGMNTNPNPGTEQKPNQLIAATRMEYRPGPSPSLDPRQNRVIGKEEGTGQESILGVPPTVPPAASGPGQGHWQANSSHPLPNRAKDPNPYTPFPSHATAESARLAGTELTRLTPYPQHPTAEAARLPPHPTAEIAKLMPYPPHPAGGFQVPSLSGPPGTDPKQQKRSPAWEVSGRSPERSPITHFTEPGGGVMGGVRREAEGRRVDPRRKYSHLKIKSKGGSSPSQSSSILKCSQGDDASDPTFKIPKLLQDSSVLDKPIDPQDLFKGVGSAEASYGEVSAPLGIFKSNFFSRSQTQDKAENMKLPFGEITLKDSSTAPSSSEEEKAENGMDKEHHSKEIPLSSKDSCSDELTEEQTPPKPSHVPSYLAQLDMGLGSDLKIDSAFGSLADKTETSGGENSKKKEEESQARKLPSMFGLGF